MRWSGSCVRQRYVGHSGAYFMAVSGGSDEIWAMVFHLIGAGFWIFLMNHSKNPQSGHLTIEKHIESPFLMSQSWKWRGNFTQDTEASLDDLLQTYQMPPASGASIRRWSLDFFKGPISLGPRWNSHKSPGSIMKLHNVSPGAMVQWLVDPSHIIQYIIWYII